MLKLNNISSIISISISNTTTSREGLLLLWYAAAAPIIHLLLLLFIITLLLLLIVVVYYYNYSIPSKKINYNKKNNTSTITPTTTSTASSYDQTWTISPIATTTHDDHHHHHDTSDVNETMSLAQDDTTLEQADAKYAQELQFQEALLASSSSSILASQTSTSTYNKARPSSLSSLIQNNNNIQHQMCRICFEKQEYWQMFTNTTCSHSFCYDCTRKHATTKILEKISSITCPELNCNCMLDFNSLRLIVPKHILIKWDQVLCESTILESQKFYCPFANCSALLINDDSTITQNNCPVCNRSICAVCHVPWHSEFTCKEFGKLNMTNKKGKKDYEKLAVALAKKNKWKKCPNCKFFVEKAEGCVHITCRCKYEFCYDCGNKWTSNHGGCKPRS